MKYLILLVASLFICGCATSPVSSSSASVVPSDRLLSGYAPLSSPAPGKVKITIVRDSGMLGAAVPAKLSIEGADVAKFRRSERLDLYLDPASYIFGLEPSPRLAGALVEATFENKPGKDYYFRISDSGDGHFVLQPSTHLN